MRLLIALLIVLNIPMQLIGQRAEDNSPQSILQYRELGPFRGGRSCAVTGVPEKPNLFYFGATGGGVWKTEDGGRTWGNISDGYFGGSVGSIAVADSDPNVIYVGGGEKTVRGNVSYGYGVWKSVNAGKTWESAGLPSSRHIPRIRIHPHNPDIVFAAVLGDLFKDDINRGVYKSIDGGKSWKKVLYASADAGAVDLIIDPTNHRIMYASTWKVRRTPYSLSSGGEGSALYKSTDGGDTWVKISTNKGFPSGTLGIIGITVSPLNGERLYAIVENDNGGLYTSYDGGATWQERSKERSLRQRAWYYSRIYADTKDEETVYVVNVSYHKSTDGGRTFKSANAPHGDHHDLWIAPEDNTRMIIGDDGGAQVTYDGGDTWSTYHNQPTSQFYRVTTDNAFPYRIYAAQQDNSTIRIKHRTTGWAITDDDWESTAGGESAHIAVDPEDNDIVYGGSYGGYLTRYNHRTETERAINVYPDNPMGYGAEGMKYRFQWNFPIFFSPHNPDRLFTCSQHLHMSEDEGYTWKVISPDLSRNEAEKLVSSGGPITKDNTGVEYYATIFAAAESPVQEGVIWAGTDDGRIHVTRDAGGTWTEVTSTQMPKYLMFNSVEPSRHDPATCYIAGTSYKMGDYAPYLYKTNDYGRTWKKITNGIAAEHFTRVLREDLTDPNILYAGTESGMYISYDKGATWATFQLNLPIVPITDITLKENDLIVATQGRGLWMIDDLHLINEIKEADTKDSYLYQPADDYRMSGGGYSGSKTNGTNKKAGIDIPFFIKKYDEKKDTVSLTFIDGQGDTIITYSNHDKDLMLKVEEGNNHFVWDMKYPGAKKFDGMILWWASLSGPTAAPGNYEVSMNYNGQHSSKKFNILPYPLSEAIEADTKALFEFSNSVIKKVDEAHQAIIDIRKMKEKIGKFKPQLKDSIIIKELDTIDSIISKVENELYQTKNRSNQDPLNFPIKLTNKLAHLNSLANINTGDFRPTQGMLEVKEMLEQAIDKQLMTWKDVKESRIPKVNEMMRKAEVDFF